MATSLELLRARTRLELGDLGETFTATLTYDGESRILDTPVRVLSTEGVSVIVEGSPDVIWIQGVDYEVAETEGEIVIIRAGLPAAGTIIRIQGTGYKFFSNTEMDTFVTEAFRLHLVGRNPMPTYANLPATEDYLVAILAAIEALWVMATDASFDIDIGVPEGVSIPRSQRFAQIMALINQRMEQYKELASALAVGPFRIQMFNLRRVSRTTNRLVPIYVPQEFDDRTYPPVRVFAPIDTGLAG